MTEKEQLREARIKAAAKTKEASLAEANAWAEEKKACDAEFCHNHPELAREADIINAMRADWLLRKTNLLNLGTPFPEHFLK